MARVSVIIPVYGVEKYIERCARSLFEQTLDDIEYLFIDDCTPDNSIEVLRKVLDEYPNRRAHVIIHRMEQNSGQAKVREWGMRNASGVYIAHCDSDDWIDKTMYEDLYNTAVKCNADMVVSDFYIERQAGSCIHNGFNHNGDTIGNFLLRVNKCCLWNKLIKTSLFNTSSFRYPAGNMGEDMAIILQILPDCERIEYLNNAYYHYVENNNSICHTIDYNNVIRKHSQLKANVDQVINLYEYKKLLKDYTEEFNSLKLHVRQCLEGLMDYPEVLNKWRETYPELCLYDILCNRYISFKAKVKSLIIYTKPVRNV